VHARASTDSHAYGHWHPRHGRAGPQAGASGTTEPRLLTPDTQRGTSCTIPPRSRPLTVLIVGSRCGLSSRACTRFYGLSRLWTLAPEAWASWATSRSEWDDRASPCHVRYSAGNVVYNSARSRPLTVLIVGSRCGLSRACTRFYGLSRLWTLAPEAWASWATTRCEWDDQVFSYIVSLMTRGTEPRSRVYVSARRLTVTLCAPLALHVALALPRGRCALGAPGSSRRDA
jgi:hypothetical protein